MKMRELGQSGINASAVAFGAWAIGGFMWGGSDEAESIKAIHAALDNGMNLIDTAPMYGMGRSETIVGKALQGGYRKKAVIATKCTMTWDGSGEDGCYFFPADDSGRLPDDAMNPKYRVFKNNKPRQIRKCIDASLLRLQTDVIDLYQTHWQDPTTPIEDTMGELLKLKQEGKIRAIGCCNASIDEMDKYRALGTLDSDQEKFNLIDRAHEKQNLPYCEKHKMAFLSYSSLAQGLLTGSIGIDRVFPAGDQRARNPRYSVENRKKILGFASAIRPIADDLGMTIGQLVTAWTISRPGCTHALLGARNAAQVTENAKGGEIELTREMQDKINSIALEKLKDVA